MTRRILFVDDEQRVLEALCRMLRTQRHVWDMVCSNDPQQAWEHLQETTFDVVVSDINMPDMSGLELLERIRGSATLRDVPVIMLTGLDSRGMKRQALDMGAADLLNKPVEAEDLIARLSSVFRLKDYHDELKSQNALLEQRVQERTADLNRSRLEAIWRLAKAAALEIMRRSACGHFDPHVYAAFLKVLPDIQHVRSRCTDERRSLPNFEEVAHVASAVC